MMQLDLRLTEEVHECSPVWTDLRLLPVYLCGLSSIVLFFTALTCVPTVKRILSRHIAHSSEIYENLSAIHTQQSARETFQTYVQSQGGPVIFALKILKLVGCNALVILSVITVLLTDLPQAGLVAKHCTPSSVSSNAWSEIGLTVAYTFSAVLLALSFVSRPICKHTCNMHATIILLVLFGVFAWRNLLPLATYDGIPADIGIVWLLWSRGSLVTAVGVLIPLVTPRIYRPVDPSEPAPAPNPEQTASILSFLLVSFMDHVVFAAYRVPRLLYDNLPPLADYDGAKYLAARSLDRLDPLIRKEKGLKKQHLFFSLMSIFRWEYVSMALYKLLTVFSDLLRPIGTNRLLTYLEYGGEEAVVRPWVWIVIILLAPILESFCSNLYIFTSTRMTVQLESIITQLVFRHSLKVRMVDGTRTASASASTSSTASLVSEVEGIDGNAVRDNSAIANGESALPSGEVSGSDAPSISESGQQQNSTTAANANSESEKSTSSHLVGLLNNLITTDLGNITEGRDFLDIIIVPLQMVVSVVLLYAILGWAAIVGMTMIGFGFPLSGKVAHLIDTAQKERMKKTDARVQAITETLNILRMVKMFGWEAKIKEQISEKREEELKWIMRTSLLGLFIYTVNFLLPLSTMVVTYAVFTLVMKQELTAARLFSSLILFDSLRRQFNNCVHQIPTFIQAKVSLDRLSEFLWNTELLDRFTSKETPMHFDTTPDMEHDVIGFHKATFRWLEASETTSGPRRRNFCLQIDDVIFKPNTINIIVGPTGCGKTSMLMALLGEMRFQPLSADSWFNLPRSHGVSYAAQESWLQNDTIKNNILFGESYDAERYKKVLFQCALDHDLSLFDAGDETEVGEKGLTLSGGQKARVTLARAIYSQARIVLLDDVLSALDVHTAKHVVEQCFRGDLIEGRTILLVTHSIALAIPVAGNIISLDIDGRILSQGAVQKAVSSNPLLRAKMKESVKDAQTGKESENLDSLVNEAAGTLVITEEIAEGRISWTALKLFFGAFGSPLFWIVLVGGFAFAELTQGVLDTWWLGVWASAYEQTTQREVHAEFYLGVWLAIVLTSTLVVNITYAIFLYGGLRASRQLHERLFDRVLGSTLRWIDITPVGRITSRLTQDIRAVDSSLRGQLGALIQLTLFLLWRIGAIIVISPIFMVPGFVLAMSGMWLAQVYLSAQLSVKREMSNHRSPLLSHFAAVIAGLVSIRAYAAEISFEDEMSRRIDMYSRPARTFYSLNRWMDTRINILGGFFAASLAVYLVYGAPAAASSTGFSLDMAIGFSGGLLYWVEFWNDFEVSTNSIERILDYLVIDQEPASTTAGAPPAYWPSSGAIRVDGLSARYSADGPVVLSGISFEIKSGERVGIVGRTGSGKSSLALALLRLIPTSGVVHFDGRQTHETNLDALRSSLTVIPQDPTLISGTLRTNLDPFSTYDDAVLSDALRAARLYRLQRDDGDNRITLDMSVASGGSNFSVGQRQIIALARAIVRNPKVLILDEATASVDAETDNAIQESIRKVLRHATLITIAHRLQTIADYDKIIVLDKGKLVEFDSPLALLEKDSSLFRALVNESVDRDQLWEMAKKSRTRTA